MKTVGLVACTSRKRAHPIAAEHLYDSPLFKGASYYSKTRCDSWYILSAKHGLVAPSDIVDPYDESLIGADKEKRKKWAKKVFSKLKMKLAQGDRVVLLAGKPYREYLEPLLTKHGARFAAPLSSLGIGSQSGWLLNLANQKSRLHDLDHLYSSINRLRDGVRGARTLRECTGKIDWPHKGIYLFFEPSEYRMSSPFEQRITRVGTHSVSFGSTTTLWHRLRTHRGGAEDGSGNHRGSIFRLHVGDALIRSKSIKGTFSNWGIGQSASPDVRRSEVDLERMVSARIGAMSILWLAIEDSASPQSDRAYLERNTIGLLAGQFGPIDLPSSTWLGKYSSKSAIRSSGLWNINYVDGSYDRRFLETFDQYVDATIGKTSHPTKSIAPKNWHSDARKQLGAKQLSLI